MKRLLTLLFLFASASVYGQIPGSAVDTTKWGNRHHLWLTDNTYDIGASGANRPRRLYIGTEIVFPDATTMNSASVGSAGSISNNTDASITADADNNGTGSILFKVGLTQEGNIDTTGLNLSSGNVYKLNGADINTPGTLSNVAYENQANIFTTGQTFSSDIIMTAGSAAVRTNTSDGADTNRLLLSGGGSVSEARGAAVQMYGNEHATLPGDLFLDAGAVAGGDIFLRTGAAFTTRMLVDSSGLVGINKSSSLTAQMQIDSDSASRVGLIVNSAATPTANIQEWKANGTTVAHVDPQGDADFTSLTLDTALAASEGGTGLTSFAAGTDYWSPASDGAGSGLDADLLDGISSSGFATSGHNHDSTYVAFAGTQTITGAKTFNGGITMGADISSGGVSDEIGSGANPFFKGWFTHLDVENNFIWNGVLYTIEATNGDPGEQLQTDGSGNLTWAAAGSLSEYKNIQNWRLEPEQALERVLSLEVAPFTYKPGHGTNDTNNLYQGIIGDHAPEFMHYNDAILDPVSTFGYTVLAIQALNARIAELERITRVIR